MKHIKLFEEFVEELLEKNIFIIDEPDGKLWYEKSGNIFSIGQYSGLLKETQYVYLTTDELKKIKSMNITKKITYIKDEDESKIWVSKENDLISIGEYSEFAGRLGNKKTKYIYLTPDELAQIR
jgi:ABC-type enterochelin transport system ATPase subunit